MDDGAAANLELRAVFCDSQTPRVPSIRHVSQFIVALITGGEAEKPAHADVIRIIVLNKFFATQGVDNRGLQAFRDLEKLSAGAFTFRTTENRDSASCVQPV